MNLLQIQKHPLQFKIMYFLVLEISYVPVYAYIFVVLQNWKLHEGRDHTQLCVRPSHLYGAWHTLNTQ